MGSSSILDQTMKPRATSDTARSWSLAAALLVACTALLFGAFLGGTAKTGGERASELADKIRCPLCRGQSVADSNVPIASEIRADIRDRVAKGQSDEEILYAYVQRYGSSVLLTPAADGVSSLVWIVPVVVAGAIAATLTVVFDRRRRVRNAATAEDFRIVQIELGRRLSLKATPQGEASEASTSGRGLG